MQHTQSTFAAEYLEYAGTAARAGDYYYHLECRAAGAACSVHEVQRPGDVPIYLRVPTDGAASTITREDIRGQDRAA